MSHKYCFFLIIALFGVLLHGKDTLRANPQSLSGVPENFEVEITTHVSQLFPGLTYPVVEHPKVGLALSGGGLKGIAHIGVLKALEEEGIPIDYITGTSSGSIIGGLYALGYSVEEIDSITLAINFDEILIDQTRRRDLFVSQKEYAGKYLLDVRFENLRPYIPISISSGQRIGNQLTNLFLNSPYNTIREFDKLKVPFRAVATELETGDKVVIRQGNWVEAIRASSSIPMVLSPVYTQGQQLIDGGVADNIPIDLARDLGADMVIAVDVRALLYKPSELRNLLTVADQVITILMNTSRVEALDNADLVISPDFEAEHPEIKSQVEKNIYRGYLAAKNNITRIREHLLTLKNSSARKVNVEVDSVEIKGNRLLDTENVHELMGELYQPEKSNYSSTEIDSIIQHLYRTGYFHKVSAKFSVINSDSVLQFELMENVPVDSISIEGVSLLDVNLFRDKLQLMTNNLPYNPRMLQILLTDLLKRYRKNGYSFAKVDTVAWQPSEGYLGIRFSEGALHNVNLEGNEYTKDYVIQREVSLSQDEPITQKAIVQSITNIHSTELFEYVGAEFIPSGSSDYWNMKVHVREKRYFGAKAGFRVNNQRGDAGIFTIENQNFLGQGMYLMTDVKVGSRERYFQAHVGADRFFNTYLTYEMNAGHIWSNYEIYDQQIENQDLDYILKQNFFTYSMGHQIARLGLVDMALNLKSISIDGPSSLTKYNQAYEISSISAQSVIDTKDETAFPKSGNYQKVYYELATDQLGGTESYTKFEFISDWYLTFLKRNTLHAGLQIGLGDETIPYSEWFVLGGIDSFFGLREYEFWGTKLYKGNVEYRYRLPVSSLFNLNFYFRYDIAAITEDVLYDISNKDFFNGQGLAVGVSTPAGPLKIGYGRNSLGKDTFYFYFGWDF